ncbi:hypothetical protein DRH27_02250 [Candidatus Falkowbacteria bacterium]|nr:MAG: hypothetical protein DRH27_02250 [Candidatus Falkowbacteria bacterium]
MPYSLQFNPPTLKEELETIAQFKAIPTSALINAVLKQYVEQYNDGNAAFITGESIFNEFKPDAATFKLDLKEYVLLALASLRPVAKMARLANAKPKEVSADE